MSIFARAWDRTVRAFAASVPADAREGLARDVVRGGVAVRAGALVDAALGIGRSNPAALWQSVYAKRPLSVALGEAGAMDTSLYDLLDEIREEPGVAGCLKTLVDRFGKLPVLFVPGSDDPRDEKAALECEATLTRASGENGWRAMLLTMPMAALSHGAAVFQTIWEPKGGVFAPRNYLHEHPGHFSWSEHGDLLVRDGAKWVPATRGKFAVMRNPEFYHGPHGRSELYGWRFLHQAQRLALKGWITFAEVSGVPLLIVKVPPTAESPSEARSEAMEFLENLGGSNGAVFLNGEEIQALSRDGGMKASPSEAVVEWIERLKARYLTGGELTQSQGAKSGNFALGKIHDAGADDRVATLAGFRDEALQRGLVDPWVEWHFGPEARVKIVTDTETREDAETTERILKTATVIGVPTSMAEARERLGLRAPKPGEELLPMAGDDVPDAPDTGGREGKTGAKKKPKPEEGDDEEEFSEFAEGLSAEDKAARAVAWEMQTRLTKIGAALEDENAKALMAALEEAADVVRRIAGSRGLERMDESLAALAGALESPEIASGYEALAGARGLALAEIVDATGRVLEYPAADVGEMPEPYRRGAEWMRARKIASKSDVEKIARGLARLYPGRGEAAIDAMLRAEVLAMKDSIGAAMTTRFRDAVARSVARGGTVAEFLAAIDADVAAGRLPVGMDGYVDLVFRQETANAYAVEREAAMSNPDVDPFTWGRRLWNAMLPSSRETHRGINGLALRKGSEADRAAGHPPWAFRCTCTETLLIAADGIGSYVEPADALERVRRIERFR